MTSDYSRPKPKTSKYQTHNSLRHQNHQNANLLMIKNVLHFEKSKPLFLLRNCVTLVALTHFLSHFQAKLQRKTSILTRYQFKDIRLRK